MASYATVAEFKSYITGLTGGVQASFTSDEDTLLQTFLDEATAEIERATGRKFAPTESQTRYYREDAVDGDTLHLDTDFLSVTSLTNGDGTTISSGNYWLIPDNRDAKTDIKLKSGYVWAFDTDGRVTVAGTTGFSTTAPADIKRVTKRLAYFYWLKRAASGETTFQGEGTATQAAEYPADIMKVLKRYKRGRVL